MEKGARAIKLQVSESRCFVSLATTSSLFVYSIVDPPYDNLNPYLRLVQRVESPHNLPITDPTFAPQQYEKSGIHDVPLVPRVLTVSADTTVKVHKIKAVTNWLYLLFIAVVTFVISTAVINIQLRSCDSPQMVISTCEHFGIGTVLPCERTVFEISNLWCAEHKRNFGYLLEQEGTETLHGGSKEGAVGSTEVPGSDSKERAEL